MKPPEAMVKSWPVLLLRAVSGCVAMQQQGSVSVSMAHVTPMVTGLLPGPMSLSKDCTGLALPHTTAWASQ